MCTRQCPSSVYRAMRTKRCASGSLDREARAFPFFQPALISTNAFVAKFDQFLCRHPAQRALRAAAVYDDHGILGQIRAAHLVSDLVDRHAPRTGNILALEPFVRQDIPEFKGTIAVQKLVSSSVETVLTTTSLIAIGLLTICCS